MESRYVSNATWVDAYVTSAVCPSCLEVVGVGSIVHGMCPNCGKRIYPSNYVPALNKLDSYGRALEISDNLKKERAMNPEFKAERP